MEIVPPIQATFCIFDIFVSQMYCQPGNDGEDPPILISYGGSKVVDDKLLPYGKKENDYRFVQLEFFC